MKKFLLGLIIGAFFTAGSYFLFSWDTKLHTDVGKLLDMDTLCLKDGDVIDGWILYEDNENILVETEKGSFTLPRSTCISIKKNTFLQYIRELM